MSQENREYPEQSGSQTLTLGADEYFRSESKLLGYALIPYRHNRFQWDSISGAGHSDRYGYSIRVDGMSPMLAGVSNFKPHAFDDIIDGALDGLRLVTVKTRHFNAFCEDVLYERAQNEEDDRFWIEEVCGSIEPVPETIAEDFLGYDVVTSWMKREPVPHSLLSVYDMTNAFDLFATIEGAIDFRHRSAQVAEGEVFILEVFALRRRSGSS